MRFLFYIIIIFTLFNSVSYARPISYAGGWTTMFINDDNRNKMHVHFSPTHKMSIGLNIEYFHDEELFFNSMISINCKSISFCCCLIFFSKFFIKF